MEENYWKQFCSTGAVEDYLRYTDAREKTEEQKYAAYHGQGFGDGGLSGMTGSSQRAQDGRLR